MLPLSLGYEPAVGKKRRSARIFSDHSTDTDESTFHMGRQKKRSKQEEILEKLVSAATGRELCDRRAWLYGWAVETYRRSSEAAIPYIGEQSVSLSADAVAEYEVAMQHLLELSPVKESYDHEELWALVASLIGSVPFGHRDTVTALIQRRLSLLISAPPSVIAFPLANVAWSGPPLLIGDLLIGICDERWIHALASLSVRPSEEVIPDKVWWVGDESTSAQTADSEDALPPSVAFAMRSRLQSRRAFDAASEVFTDLLSLALVFESDLDQRGLFSGRGDSHRPGIRGLTLDRHALSFYNRMFANSLGAELAATSFTAGFLGKQVVHHWYGEDPFPLEDLLVSGSRASDINDILQSNSSIAGRFRTAARWHAKAHWSADPEDAVLALGIALDALLGESGGSPGRVLAERFALLERDKHKRPERYKQFSGEFYPARSSVAHGSRSSLLGKSGFVRFMAAEMRWAFAQLHTRTKERRDATETDHRTLFDQLKWGLQAR